MLSYLFDFLFLLVAVATACLVSRKCMVHSAAYYVATLVASLLAITTFERASTWIQYRILLPMTFRIDLLLYFFVTVVIFAAALEILLWCIHTMLPDAPQMSERTERIGRWVCGALTGYLFASFLLTACLTLPAPREYWGAFAPEADRRPGPIMALAPDYQFLALAEYTCDHAFALTGGEWLLDRPVLTAQSNQGRWSSFPIRYAIWRETHEGRWFD